MARQRARSSFQRMPPTQAIWQNNKNKWRSCEGKRDVMTWQEGTWYPETTLIAASRKGEKSPAEGDGGNMTSVQETDFASAIQSRLRQTAFRHDVVLENLDR